MAASENFYAGVALGFRTWMVEDGLLWPLWHRRHHWEPGVTVARCTQTSAHDHTATANCQCGLHAYHSLTQAAGIRACGPLVDGALVIGAVAGAYDLRVHHDGWRAPEAQIIALYLDYGRQEKMVEGLAERYGTTVFRHDWELEALLPDWVAVIPENDRPPAAPTRSSLLDYLR